MREYKRHYCRVSGTFESTTLENAQSHFEDNVMTMDDVDVTSLTVEDTKLALESPLPPSQCPSYLYEFEPDNT
jgi:hypothetical protein